MRTGELFQPLTVVMGAVDLFSAGRITYTRLLKDQLPNLCYVAILGNTCRNFLLYIDFLTPSCS